MLKKRPPKLLNIACIGILFRYADQIKSKGKQDQHLLQNDDQQPSENKIMMKLYDD